MLGFRGVNVPDLSAGGADGALLAGPSETRKPMRLAGQTSGTGERRRDPELFGGLALAGDSGRRGSVALPLSLGRHAASERVAS